MYSRRDFGKMALAGVTAPSLAKINSTIQGVRLAVQTYSFREFPPETGVDSVIKANRKSTRLNSSHIQKSRMPSSA